ncbi:hypothetical protein [Amycolatopsis circi]|uniref:hypothetical protein n=1 Tax=Amycolatopsis circi TaxID=871959 RepID=UPI000E22A915|nr:hypothetical protein [Amycolatopsis circi]
MSLTSPKVDFRTPRRKSCERCGEQIPPGKLQTALVLDSSRVDPADFARYGQRLVHACGDDHMAQLVEQARRDWVDEQWWFGLLCQASRSAERESLSELARRARLSAGQLDAALEWNARTADPLDCLPGGQPC